MKIKNDLIEYICWQKKHTYIQSKLFYCKNLFISILAKILCTYYSNKKIERQKYNILFLKRDEDGFIFEKIGNNLPENITFVVAYQKKPSSILKEGLLCSYNGSSKFILKTYEDYANYLIKRFSPKVIVTERNGSIFSPILKKISEECSIKVVHIAHSIPTKNFRHFCMIDYHYYLVFGKSSFDFLRERERTYGSTNFIFSGSCHIQERLKSQSSTVYPSLGNDDVFILLGSGPGYEEKTFTKKYYKKIIDIISERRASKLIFKPHPRSDMKLWGELVTGLDTDRFLVINKLFKNNSIKMAFCGYTNAILDVTLLDIIPVLIAEGINDDMFKYANFFGTPVVEKKDISGRIDFILENFDTYKKAIYKFREYHLTNIDDSTKFVSHFLSCIVRGEDVEKQVSAKL